MNVLKIYTPKEDELLLKSVLQDYKIENYSLNDTLIFDKDDIILHYKSKLLDKNVKSKILEHIQHGHIVMSFIDYLDSKFAFTEITLLNSDYFLHRKAFGALRSKRRKTVKRLGAVLTASLLGFLLSPIMLITAIFIKLESKGPVFYRQKRVGLFNEEFEVIKFRSMYIDAEKDGAMWAVENDKRVTKVGNFIRKTRIDELPQLWNVLKGEMNLVGPRPEREVFIKELEKEIPYYRFRHAVKPGVTGYAQVKYQYGASIEDAKWKHRYDMYYIKYQSLWMDIKIIFLTVKVVLFGMGR
jgi:exopolysaccharide biosynthesis polyprenyl glycosylphosphotransferase